MGSLDWSRALGGEGLPRPKACGCPTRAAGAAAGPLGDPDWEPPKKPDTFPRVDVRECDTEGWYVAGDEVAELVGLDDIVRHYMTTNGIPNGAVAVLSPDGRLVYARAYTQCSLLEANGEEVFCAGVHTRFRVASVSKAITAVTVMRAAERGLFGARGLDAKVADFLDFTTTFTGGPPDSRLQAITLRHLLTHTAGWYDDEDGGGGEFPRQSLAAYSPGYEFSLHDDLHAMWLGKCLPITPEDVLRASVSTSLSFTPGTVYSYSNHGFNLLGWLLEAVGRKSYGALVREWVWDPLGAADADIAGSTLAERQREEVRYYHFPNTGRSRKDSLLTADCRSLGGREVITGRHQDYAPYAHRNLANCLGASGWIASIHDLALLLRDLFYGRSKVLRPWSVAEMIAPKVARSGSGFDGLGWHLDVNGAGSGGVFKSGGMPGSHAMACWAQGAWPARTPGASFLYVFNRTHDPSGPYPRSTLDNYLGTLLGWVSDWGAGDLFEG